MVIEDIDYLYKNSVKENIIIKIDSSKRDKNIYPSPNNYKLTFTEPFKYVYGIDILDAALPRTQYQIDNHNNELYFLNTADTSNSNIIQSIKLDINDYNIDDLMTQINEKLLEKHGSGDFHVRVISLTVPTNNTNIFYFDNQDSNNNPFYIFAYKSSLSEVLGLDKYTQPSSNNHRQFSKTDDSVVWELIQDETEYTEIEKINHTYKSINIDRAELSYPTRGTNVHVIIPDMINLTGDRFIKLRCNAIEKYLPSYYSGSNSIGLGLFKLSVSGYTDEKFDFTSVEYKDLHPIGKFASIDLKFEMLNGKLYDFKGVDHHFLLNIKYYVPTQNNNNVNKKDYVLNTNYNPNLLDYKRTQYEKDDNSEDEINELANNFKKNFLEKEKEYEYSSDEDLDFINPYIDSIDSSGSESSIDTSSEEENGMTPFHPNY